MKTNLKVLIADDSESFGRECQKELKEAGFDVIITAKDGSRVMSVIDAQHIDVVLIDAFMPNGDAIDILEHLNSSLNEKPLVAVISSVDSQDFEEQMISAGANYYFIKPVTPQSVARRIVSLASWKTQKRKREQNSISDSDIEITISDIMRQIGVPAHIKGYQYLRTAIKLSINDSEMLGSVTKLLYPIEVAWDRGDVDVLSSYFGYTIQSQRGKPTNSEFIAMIADKLKLSLKTTA